MKIKIQKVWPQLTHSMNAFWKRVFIKAKRKKSSKSRALKPGQQASIAKQHAFRAPRALKPGQQASLAKKNAVVAPQPESKGYPSFSFGPTTATNSPAISSKSHQFDTVNTEIPCNAVDECVQQHPKRPRKRTVSFAAEAKDWDGMRPDNERLECVIQEFWEKKPAIRTLRALHDNSQEHELRKLRTAFLSVVLQVTEHPDCATALLPHGGGQGIKFNGKHLSKMNVLHSVICKVHDKVVRYLASRTHDDQITY